jgi:hypothetical protein
MTENKSEITQTRKGQTQKAILLFTYKNATLDTNRHNKADPS